MLSRRTFTAALTGLATALNLKAADAKPVPKTAITTPGASVMRSLNERGHTLFGTTYEDNSLVPGMEWQPVNTPVDLGPKAHIDSGMGREEFETEIYTAVMQEHLAALEKEWLDRVKRHAGERSIFSQSSVTGNVTFLGDIHAGLGVLINREITRRAIAGQSTNTIVLSPLALTILQSSTNSLINRADESEPLTKAFGPRYVGFINSPGKEPGEKIRSNLLVDCYAWGDQPVLIGFVPEIPQERAAAVVMTSPTSMDYGERPNAHAGWDAVGIDSGSIAQI